MESATEIQMNLRPSSLPLTDILTNPRNSEEMLKDYKP